ncbi:alpha/beta hydrolase [Lentisphaera marina]|uniref:alpha/beta hydrolase n=1 Tax=Lentisphaera marina TaxID=1111041 RepID=UPI0023650D33|nr:alpha/beta hydrolase [Lentisphaera marina]MDD7986560.1 alpha/beta hydrolase [Lentisphaera marina]
MKLDVYKVIISSLLVLSSVLMADTNKTQAGFRGVKYIPAPGLTQKTEVYKTIAKRELQMHFHFPKDWKASDNRPVMIFFFGGGWKGGSTQQFLIQADYFASRGIVTARADYRVKTKDGVSPNLCVEDARSAVRWLRANAAKLGIDTNKVIAAGGSAGGHLAFCTSIKQGLDASSDDKSISCIPQVMVLYNPALFKSSFSKAQERVAQGQMSMERLKKMSPLDHVDAKTPPALILFGTADKLKEGGDIYMKMANELGLRAEMYTADKQGYGFFNNQPWLDKTTEAVDKFLVSLAYIDAKK